MLCRGKAVAHFATVLPMQDFAYGQQFKIAHYNEIMQLMGITFISERLVFPEMPLLTDQYLMIVLRVFWEILESLLFLTSKAMLCQTCIILKTQLLYSGGWKETNSRDHGNPHHVNYLGVGGGGHQLSHHMSYLISKWTPFKMTNLEFRYIFFKKKIFKNSKFKKFKKTSSGSFTPADLSYGKGLDIFSLVCLTPPTTYCCSGCHRQWHRSVKMLQGKSHLGNLKEKKLVTAAGESDEECHEWNIPNLARKSYRTTEMQ